MMTVTVEFVGLTQLEEAIQQASDKAKSLGMAIRFKFNDVWITTSGTDNIEQLITQYNYQRTRVTYCEDGPHGDCWDKI